jgi:hypothetical protein
LPRPGVKPAYGPTLAQLLAPRWRAASVRARVAVVAACGALFALALVLALTLLNAEYSRGGNVPFSFSYRGLDSVAPESGGYVRVESRRPSGALEYSFAVDPLKLPGYRGGLTGAVALYATGYERALERRYPGFELRGEGKTRISNSITGYEVAYTALVEGREMYGRNILLLPERPGVREGVTIVMLAQPGASAQVLSPLEVATTGTLLRPLKTFEIS